MGEIMRELVSDAIFLTLGLYIGVYLILLQKKTIALLEEIVQRMRGDERPGGWQ